MASIYELLGLEEPKEKTEEDFNKFLEQRKTQQELPEESSNEVPLPFGGLQGEDLQKAMETSPLSKAVATTGLNPLSLREEEPSSLFSQVSDKLAQKQMTNNIGINESPRMPTAKAPLDIKRIEEALSKPISAPTSPYGEELGDAALKQAQQRSALAGLVGGLADVSSEIGAALSKGTVKPTKAGDVARELGQVGVKNILERRAALDKEFEQMDKAKLRNPNSEVSKSMREGLKELYPTIKIPENVSAQQLRDLGMNYGSLIVAKESIEARKEAAKERARVTEERAKERLEERKTAREEKKSKDLRQAEERFSKMVEQDQELKEFKKQGISLSQVDNIIDMTKKGNTVSSAALGAKMARAMGEVGVLTQEDVSRYVRSGALARGAADKLSSWITGKPTDATLDEIQQISSIIKENFNQKVQPIYDKYANRLSRIYDIPIDEAYSVMDLTKPQEKIRVISPTGQVGTIPKENLEKAKAAGYKEVE